MFHQPMRGDWQKLGGDCDPSFLEYPSQRYSHGSLFECFQASNDDRTV